MLVFFWGGGQGGRWAPLLALAPILLALGGTVLGNLLGFFFGGGLSGGSTWVYDPRTQMWRRQGAPSSPAGAGGAASSSSSAGEDSAAVVGAVLGALTNMIVTAALTVVLMKFTLAARRHGVGPTLRRMLTNFFGGWDEGIGGGDGRPGGGGSGPRSRDQRLARVARLMQRLPVEVYKSREELERLGAAELKALLKKRGLATEQVPLEKAELVAALAAGENSSAAACSICCDDYASDDVLRVLRCGHRFHLECIDRWLLSSTDYSRPPACPFCNKELEAPAAAAAAGSGGTGS